MRAIQVSEFGGPGVLAAAELPAPEAGAGQVVVGVAVAAIDFVQTQLRRGYTPGPPLPELPYVPGGTVAGEVRALGEGVDGRWLGRRVVARTATAFGGYAEQAVSDVDGLVEVPDGLGLAEAAALHDDGSTAIGLLNGVAVRPGEWVLVEAAAGGVGSLLVQLAIAAGAQVIGAARGERKLALIRELGAKGAVDYSEPDWTEQVRALIGGGPDVVFDGVGGEIGRAALEITAPGGRFSVHGASSGTPTMGSGPDGVTVLGIEQLFSFAATARARVEQALAEAAAGRLRPVIGQTLPLARAAEAHAAIEARAVTGKTLLLT
ncbi:zinc-binding dehydrogenase [Amycolatopsis acidicola]|uniref:Zinc-binding dehydrogenase n=1 Tax=Amycolatopsis acidicola TaxID=2596893 RepID=A0A5N0USU3_9PSEU|nr:zinc-binding dehydrogenase [Amycolatopsis acidicola]KAA9154188.1 zinc-binding dehydrogenase [Amycolatopsis acidicola]